MLCEFTVLSDSIILTWLLTSILGLALVMSLSSPVFYFFYWPSNVTFAKWRYKSNPKFPTPEKVRDEILTTCKGIICATICPTLALVLLQRGYGKAYCGWNGHSLLYHVITFVLIIAVTDLYEFLYHRLGHINFRFWSQHKHHHVFYNPSPFSVVADPGFDQLMRSLPLLVIPMLAPVNMDMLFLEYGFFFYAYGVYLHSGYEVEGISAHNKYVNTSFQHYCHHAKSLMNAPYHCGFYVKLWDRLFDCCYPDEKCFCAECSRKKGERTVEEYNKIVVPDYSVLLTSQFWLQMFRYKKMN